MKLILTLLALASVTLALSPVELGAACSWTGVGATALTAALSGGEATLPLKLASSFTLGSMAYTLTAPTKWTDAHLHFMASGGIYTLGYVGLRQVLDPLPSALIAGAGTGFIAWFKEMCDRGKPGGKFDWDDIRADAIGMGSAAAGTLLFDWLVHRK
jgi:hypothetical protein